MHNILIIFLYSIKKLLVSNEVINTENRSGWIILDMTENHDEKMDRLAKELKKIIRRFEHSSFTSQIAYMANIHVRRQSGQVELRSPIRQLMYLMSLYHATDLGGTEIYMHGSESAREMITLLNEIEDGYKLGANEIAGLSKETISKIIVTKSTFLNFYLNAPLTYYEQDIERVERTFRHLEPYILRETGLEIKDYIDFFKVISKLEIERGSRYLNHDFSNDSVLASIKGGKKINDLTLDEKVHLVDINEKAIYEMSIPLTDIYQAMGEEKSKKLLVYFTLLRKENSEYLYYTDPCSYLRTPIVIMDGLHIVMVFSKQLINAIYEFLYELCSETTAPGKKVSERRDKYLEDKTTELFRDFFGPEAFLFHSYYLNGNEKDLIILNGRNAFIIECKAHKYRIPLRNQNQAYDRIRDDFKKSIGKGYQQAKEVEDYFWGNSSFELFDKQKRKLVTLNPSDYDEVFTIIVTQERFGQIQCDLSYLLDIADDRNFPWSVGIHDLEAFLITLKRKKKHKKEFVEFLLAREKLQGRVMCYDELELCAYFLFEKQQFLKKCNHTKIFFSSPKVNQYFDMLYEVGFGFKDEVSLADKLKRRHFEATSFIKFHKLKPAQRITEFLKNCSGGSED